MTEKKTEVHIDEAPAKVTVEQNATSPVGPTPQAQQPQIIYLPAPAATNSGLRQQLIGGAITLAGAAIGVYGVYLSNSISEVSAQVSEVHELANSNLAAANSRLDEALEKIEDLNVLILQLTADGQVEILPDPVAVPQ